jgi:hypothetical protein
MKYLNIYIFLVFVGNEGLMSEPNAALLGCQAPCCPVSSFRILPRLSSRAVALRCLGAQYQGDNSKCGDQQNRHGREQTATGSHGKQKDAHKNANNPVANPPRDHESHDGGDNQKEHQKGELDSDT